MRGREWEKRNNFEREKNNENRKKSVGSFKDKF